mmetsp:Transcript_33523/g.73160  ORF Transcript_33523/g.73160 Transcript_33523/m.73160 type:complete len:207 (+) Transcript_33523:641-1261(+)
MRYWYFASTSSSRYFMLLLSSPIRSASRSASSSSICFARSARRCRLMFSFHSRSASSCLRIWSSLSAISRSFLTASAMSAASSRMLSRSRRRAPASDLRWAISSASRASLSSSSRLRSLVAHADRSRSFAMAALRWSFCILNSCSFFFLSSTLLAVTAALCFCFHAGWSAVCSSSSDTTWSSNPSSTSLSFPRMYRRSVAESFGIR